MPRNGAMSSLRRAMAHGAHFVVATARFLAVLGLPRPSQFHNKRHMQMQCKCNASSAEVPRTNLQHLLLPDRVFYWVRKRSGSGRVRGFPNEVWTNLPGRTGIASSRNWTKKQPPKVSSLDHEP